MFLSVEQAPKKAPCSIPFTYKHPLEWTARFDLDTRIVVIRRPSGTTLTFAAPGGSAEALPTGASRKFNYRVRLLTGSLEPCVSGTPVWIDMAQPSGRILRFSAATGAVAALVSSTGIVTTAEDYAAQLQVLRDPATGDVSAIWSASQGLLKIVPDGHTLALKWYAPSATILENGAWQPVGDPWKTVTYTRQPADGTLTIVEQRAGMPAFTTLRREEPGCVTITQGDGDERIVRTIENRPLPGGKWETIDSLRGVNDETPARSLRLVKRQSPGGWLTLSRTEGYGSPTPRTTTYLYNDQFRVSLEMRPDGGYTRYEYDARGRVVLEASPWVGGGEKAVRTQYVDRRFNDFRPAREEEFILSEEGRKTTLHTRDYAYEETPELLRTTVAETALGSPHVRTSVSETYGSAASCPYARGRQKYNRAADGVETVYAYEASSEHGAAYRITKTVQAGGSAVPGRASRTVSYVDANGRVTRSERHVLTQREGWAPTACADYEYDVEGRRARITRGNGRTSRTEWMCCGPLRETGEDGIVTSYGYNSARQLVETIRSATETTPETITGYVRDAAGRLVKTRVDQGPMTTQTETLRDMLGRTIRATDALGRVTCTSYSEDSLETVVTLPSGATLRTKRHHDGTIVSQSGDGQRAVETRVELTREGILETLLSHGTVLSKTLKNGFGEVIRQEVPNTVGGFVATCNDYNDKGQLVRTQTGNLAPTCTEYDAFGQVSRQILLLEPARPNDPTVNRIRSYDVAYCLREDGVYETRTATSYNASGAPLAQSEARLVSESSSLAAKTVLTDIYGHETAEWEEYGQGTERIRKRQLPSSDTVAVTRLVDGFAVSKTDHAGIATAQSRAYTAAGLVLKQTDARGNVSTTETDIAGRAVRVTDGAGSTVETIYCACSDQPARVTNAQGRTVCSNYDRRGRKTAEYGTAAVPLLFAYDDADRTISLTTFRAPDEEALSSDPSDRVDGDVTQWIYDDATGLELEKRYADGSRIVKTYDAMNRLQSKTNARGIQSSYAYDPATGLPTSVRHSDGTIGWRFAYNHLGQMTEASDASGTWKYQYDDFGRRVMESPDDQSDLLLHELWDAYGRNVGYETIWQGGTLEIAQIGYDAHGRPAQMEISGIDAPFRWGYHETNGMMQTLVYPNGVARRNVWTHGRNLLESVEYARAGASDAFQSHDYVYDDLARPIARTDRRDGDDGPLKTQHFSYNDRSELVSQDDGLGGVSYSYSYDNIGNRKRTTERWETIRYETNAMNEYATLYPPQMEFRPEYDADGNQTRPRPANGIWRVTYDANDRPVRFADEGGKSVVTCGYDYRGRRFEKKVVTNGETVYHARYRYRGYLAVAEIDLTGAVPQMAATHVWDPTEPTATRLLTTRNARTGERVYALHDAMKNVTSLCDESGTVRANYDYAPFGPLNLKEGDLASWNKFRFSSEYADDETGLIYYNYRHYNPADGRWISRDPVGEDGGVNLFGFVENSPSLRNDYLGKIFFGKKVTIHLILEWGNKDNLSATNWEEAIDKIDNKVYCWQCIEELVVTIHGCPSYSQITDNANPPAPTFGGPESASGIDDSNVSSIAESLKNKESFCSKCTIYWLSCNVGLSTFAQKLAEKTGCHVYAPMGFCWPNPLNPLSSRVQKRYENYPVYPGSKDNTFKRFNPDGSNPDLYRNR